MTKHVLPHRMGWRYGAEEDETSRTPGTLIACGFEF